MNEQNNFKFKYLFWNNRLTKSFLTNKWSFPQITTAFQDDLQELDLLIHHIVFRLQRNPSPVQSKLLVS